MRMRARMLLSVVSPLLLVVWVSSQTAASTALAVTRSERANIVEGYGNLPLAFEANQGQIDSQVKFLSRGAGYSLFLTPTEAVLTIKASASNHQPSVLRMKLLGSNVNTEVTGQNQLAGKSNYFIGNDPKKWHRDVPQYAKVRYANVYPGVDLVYYGNQRELEYDFVLQAGTRPEAIRLGIEGARKLRLERGDLAMTSAAGDVLLRSPRIYQEVNGVHRNVRGQYVLISKNEIGFHVSSYDRSRALVIDPVLAYSSYLGGSGDESIGSIAVDAAGNAYLTGFTNSIDFPTIDPIQSDQHGGGYYGDIFVSKLNADGSALNYSTYLGGSSWDIGRGIAVDSSGNAYVTGFTQSSDFPTLKPFQPNLHGWRNAFVSKINAAGNALVYSTYLGGGEDDAHGIAVDSLGNAHVRGDTRSRSFPVYRAIQPYLRSQQYFNFFVSEFTADGSALVYSTYWGGTCGEAGTGLAVDSAGNTYVDGSTCSADFPTVNPIQPTYAGNGDAIVTKFSADGQTVLYSTFLGGSDAEYAWDIRTDSSGNAYITGATLSTDFPTASPIQFANHGRWDAYVTKVNAAGNALTYSTYLGGSGDELWTGLAVDSAGNAYVSGSTSSTDFPTSNAIQAANHGGQDAFVTRISADGRKLLYSTYLGGSANEANQDAVTVAVDSMGSAYVVGDTASPDFRTTSLGLQPSWKGGLDSFIVKIAQQTFVNFSQKNLSFGLQLVNQPSNRQELVLANNGTNALTINNIYLAGANASDFTETNSCREPIAPGTTCSVRVTFTPSTTGPKKGLLAISDSDPASPQVIGLTGNGRTTLVQLSPTSLSFANQAVGTSSSPRAAIVTNLGKSPLNFSDITITGIHAGDFSQTNTCGVRIGAAKSCIITVTFTPTAAGIRKALVSISDDGGGSPQKIVLRGTGI